MCVGSTPKVEKATPVEAYKPAQPAMDAASDATAREQMMRRGVASMFSRQRGYGTETAAAESGKADKLG